MNDDLEEKFLYNKDGSLLAAINSSSIETYTYNPNGYLQDKYLNGQRVLSYQYNKNLDIK